MKKLPTNCDHEGVGLPTPTSLRPLCGPPKHTNPTPPHIPTLNSLKVGPIRSRSPLQVGPSQLFVANKWSKNRQEKSQEKIQAQKKSWATSSRKFSQKPIHNSKQQRGRLRRPPQKMGRRLRRCPIFGVVVMKFELVS